MTSRAAKAEGSIYHAEIVAGSLLVSESRTIAEMLLRGVSEDDWKHAITIDNVLQKKSAATAKRQAQLIRKRLVLLAPAYWQLVAHGNRDTATQTLMAAAIKHSRLLGDFLLQIVKPKIRAFNYQLTQRDWVLFIEQCAQIDSQVRRWAPATVAKLREVIFRIMAEARYLDNTRSMKITPIALVSDVRRLLVRDDERYVLACLDHLL